ncbi:hypothetical protein A2716_02840 [candidate division WWE3 bacterium RIFCSPHIGHO2_01_FULL_40_23]|uniref:TraG P-loop domain-containing protein n=1 Tax=candidate division WWE3 bacterium RIFCSPLOWO2_01_FULL_41_18 TaxID=1802625 RepID=A0A1F4VF87_UNCKA|nr:MAG: hypothetical protein A2716_02840 [candidate division WWE3 bacterium RIFCSPHIGHO2_01_FULL_40_23]OGC55922.1 MAG: hypothetical protein A3A78_02690 [candidate division WWE3 bacterium RIFCSPLOWO2_01_FULL_41_18]
MKLPINKKKEDLEKEKSAEGSAKKLAEGMVDVKDVIAPSAIEVDFTHIRVGNTYYRTLFVAGYPRFVGANWLSPLINFEHTLDISMFYYPVQSRGILDDLRRKIAEMEATVRTDRERGKIVDPTVSAALEDAQSLQEQLVKGVEKFFQFSFYVTVPADTLEELEVVTKKVESTLGSLLLISKQASLQMEQAFQTTIPLCLDKLLITRNMDTTSLATTFPFTSSDLTANEGIMYGINKHNGSLVIFDRFSLENANTVVFAKSGAGKSFFVKLEALRSMVFGSEILVIDPEMEYKRLCEAVGGNYIEFSPSSPSRINPFDLSGVAIEGENELGQKILSLHTLFKIIFGNMTNVEEAVLDKSLIEAYRIKGITTDPETQRTKEPPIMEDLYKVLLGFEEPEAKALASRLERYIKGSLAGIFDQRSNIDIRSKFTVFSTRSLEDVLRPIAIYIILDFIWTRIKKDLRKRILVIDEAWYLMQNKDSATFIYGIAKRARKYFLGLTTITQDVEDFLSSEYGHAIITSSSIQVLLKQHPAAIDKVAETFYLSEGEKRFLLSAGIGEGLFFAGSNHVAIKIEASEEEYKLVTTNPAELIKLREKGTLKEQPQTKVIYRPVPNYNKPAPPPASPQEAPQEPAPLGGNNIPIIKEGQPQPTAQPQKAPQVEAGYPQSPAAQSPAPKNPDEDEVSSLY